MLPLRPHVRTFIEAAETLLKPIQPIPGLNWDELAMMRLYLRDLDAMVLKDATALGTI